MLSDLVHLLHIAAGVVWAGGAICFAFVVEPALLRLGPGATRDLLAGSRPYVGPVMGGSGLLLLATGIGRAVLGGGIASLGDLFTPYGLYFLAALAIVLAVTALGHRHRARLSQMLESTAETTPEMYATQRRQAAVTAVGIFATIAIMTILGLGRY
jgi:putative copper export protein